MLAARSVESSEDPEKAGLKISFGVCNHHSLDRLSWSLQNDRNSGRSQQGYGSCSSGS